MILGIFARANHPQGYGYCYGPIQDSTGHHPQARAHGYVVVVVQCKDWIELRAVKDKLGQIKYDPDSHKQLPAYDPWNRGDNWYAGPYEMIWVGEGYINKGSELNMNATKLELGDRPSYGDNRAMAYLSAEEILGT